jgi:competence protein ComEA
VEQKTTGRTRAYIILCSVVALIVGGVIGRFTWSQPSAPIVVSTPAPTPTPFPTHTPAPIRIHVSGAVRQPDVYELPSGSIVKDAIGAAGGPTDDADLDCINLAVELRDQQQVHVPRRGEGSTPPPVSGDALESGETSGAPIDINTATAAELETLPGIGPSTAQKIVEYREANGPFATIEDIKNVPGIGEGKFEGIKDLITVGP